MIENPRLAPGSGSADDPNLDQKETEQEKVEIDDEDEDEDEEEERTRKSDEFEPMTERSEQKPQRPSTD